MLEYFCIFTKGGALLWAFQLTALKGSPINALIRTCLLEERSGESSFTYSPASGASYTLKWTLHNGLGLVFVAVYQKALKLLYVDELLESVKKEFAPQYKPRQYDYKSFEETFRQILRECEEKAELAKRPQLQATMAATSKRGAGKQRSSAIQTTDAEDDDETDATRTEVTSATEGLHGTSTDGSDVEVIEGKSDDTAFNMSALDKKKLARRAKGGKAVAGKAVKEPKPKKPTEKKKKQERVWGEFGEKPGNLDFSKDGELSESGANGVHPVNVSQAPKSLVDNDVDDGDDDDDTTEEDVGGVAATASKPAAKSGLLASFVRNIGVNVMGTQALKREDIQAGLDQMKKKLMERNVAEEIAEKLCESVATNLEGRKLGSFTLVSSAVRTAFEEALTRILTPKRSIDVLHEIRTAQKRGKPYTIVFVGVNGVGKSTNLAKICYWLLQNDVKVMIAACDTFRSGAVEQLKTHCTRLGVPLYERGYEKDPAKVAYEAVKKAEQTKCDVVLVDTAGRMQDNEPLMRALSNLINLNNPDLVLFVGEALVGNDAVDQLTKFNRRLADLASGPNPHTIDGIVLTKFDTIDDKVGAALSMVYTSGAPIMFVGCGQTYVDLKRLNVKSVVKSLLQ